MHEHVYSAKVKLIPFTDALIFISLPLDKHELRARGCHSVYLQGFRARLSNIYKNKLRDDITVGTR